MDAIIHYVTDTESLELFLGSAAERQADLLRSPRTRLQKLGVKPDARIAVVGVDDATLVEEIGGPLVDLGPDLDLVFYGADTIADLARLSELRSYLKPAGAIWVVSRKGKAATLKDTHVMRAARDAGLVDVKVVSFSSTHTALKLVIPVAHRPHRRKA